MLALVGKISGDRSFLQKAHSLKAKPEGASKEGAAHEQMDGWWLAQCHEFTLVAVGSFGLLIGLEVGRRAQQEPGSRREEEGQSRHVTCPS